MTSGSTKARTRAVYVAAALAAQLPAAALAQQVTVTIAVDATKPNGKAWDAFGGAPDIVGSVTVGATKTAVPFTKNGLQVTLTLLKPPLRPNTIVAVELYDRDAATDDAIGSGTFQYKGGSDFTFRAGSATITVTGIPMSAAEPAPGAPTKAPAKAAQGAMDTLIWDAIAVGRVAYARAPKTAPTPGQSYSFFGKGVKLLNGVLQAAVPPQAKLPAKVAEFFGCWGSDDGLGRPLLRFQLPRPETGPLLGVPAGSRWTQQVVGIQWNISWVGEGGILTAAGSVAVADLNTGARKRAIDIKKVDTGFKSANDALPGSEHNWIDIGPDTRLPVGLEVGGGKLLFRSTDSMRFQTGQCFGDDCYSCST